MSKLMVFKLSVQSSYAEDTEHEADAEHFDTVQWWLADEATWRIRTYAIDSDIHLYTMEGNIAEDVARDNTLKNYADITAEYFLVDLPDLADTAAVEAAMHAHGGAAALERARNGAGFAIWNPLGVHFVTRTRPEE